VTFPDAVKLNASVANAAIVPCADTVEFRVPEVTATSWGATIDPEADLLDPDEWNPNHQMPTASSATTGMITNG
jgi:hypothetical protein